MVGEGRRMREFELGGKPLMAAAAGLALAATAASAQITQGYDSAQTRGEACTKAQAVARSNGEELGEVTSLGPCECKEYAARPAHFTCTVDAFYKARSATGGGTSSSSSGGSVSGSSGPAPKPETVEPRKEVYFIVASRGGTDVAWSGPHLMSRADWTKRQAGLYGELSARHGPDLSFRKGGSSGNFACAYVIQRKTKDGSLKYSIPYWTTPAKAADEASQSERFWGDKLVSGVVCVD